MKLDDQTLFQVQVHGRFCLPANKWVCFVVNIKSA